ARDHAGHLRKEIFRSRFRGSDDLPLTPGGLKLGLARAKAKAGVCIPTDLFLPSRTETESHTWPEMCSADQVWQPLLETVLARIGHTSRNADKMRPSML